MAIVEIFHFPN